VIVGQMLKHCKTAILTSPFGNSGDKPS
jgi:hypothetical protein